MVKLTTVAQAHLEELERHYERLNRNEATVRLMDAVAAVIDRIEQGRGPFLNAPRPYPELGRLGLSWMKAGRYWVSFTAVDGDHAITGVFFETAHIPSRV